MLSAVKSEIIKLRSLRSTYVYGLFLVLSILGFNLVYLAFGAGEEPITHSSLLQGAGLFILIGVAFIGTTVGGNHSHHMHAHAFLTQNKRNYWLIALGIVLTVFLLTIAVVSYGLFLAAAHLWPGITFEATGGENILLYVLDLVIYAAIAMGLGVLTRSRVVASVVPLAMMLVIEPLLQMFGAQISAMRPVWFAMSPSERIHQLSLQLADKVEGPVGWAIDGIQPTWFNVLQPVVWIVSFVAIALVVNSRRDVR